ncbi:Uncharacterized protein PRO82_000804 [Candidatus Protochlamydia amoebophila]|uniref:thioredoxin family protein n=1 Tax=Candidatus Protochlamydia amoebophila TaxID=362787 RepID=UPI001BC9390C|nr:thioredoxin family protein [Candidatus Protochlamydia amoebophila]MBS4163501.1 Uncharacterized protein [Candidatus Protochlamydia amoebophila]
MKKITTFLISGTLTLTAIIPLFGQSLSNQQAYPNQTYAQPTTKEQMNQSKTYDQSSRHFGSQNLNESSLTWITNYHEAVAQSQSTGKPILLLFTGTNWCPACMKLEKEVLTKPEFAQGVGNQFIFFKAEFPDYGEDAIMSSPYSTLLHRYNINAFPTLVVINASGQLLFTVNYKAGGPAVYINELLQKLNPGQFSGSMNHFNTYYR